MSLYVLDVESDGPCPGKFSMVCFGLVKVSDLSKSFYGRTAPISGSFEKAALAISGFSREQHLSFPDPITTMPECAEWVKETNDESTSPQIISDNIAFDWQWINYYFWTYHGSNPFGFSGRRIGDIYAGMKKDASNRTNSEWKRLFRKTKHTHDPVDDAMGNAEAILKFIRMGLRITI